MDRQNNLQAVESKSDYTVDAQWKSMVNIVFYYEIVSLLQDNGRCPSSGAMMAGGICR